MQCVVLSVYTHSTLGAHLIFLQQLGLLQALHDFTVLARVKRVQLLETAKCDVVARIVDQWELVSCSKCRSWPFPPRLGGQLRLPLPPPLLPVNGGDPGTSDASRPPSNT